MSKDKIICPLVKGECLHGGCKFWVHVETVQIRTTYDNSTGYETVYDCGLIKLMGR